jgi:tetratricopeptide (TPR) repeat protein
MDPTAHVAELKAEIARLAAKISASTDSDIVEALKFKRDALEIELVEAIQKVEEAEALESEPAGPEVELSVAEIEKLIRVARAHFSADRKPALREVLADLEKAAPNHPDVLELKADQLMAAKDFVSAVPVLKKARKIAPKSKSIEEKLANASLKAAYAGSIESQLRAGLSDSPFLGEGDIKASATSATFVSLFLPGSGHIFIGLTVKGIAYLTAWLCSIIPLLILIRNESDRAGGARQFDFSMPMIVLGFFAIMTHMIALFEVAAIAKRGTGRREAPSRPKPPVDLPFE